MQTTRKKGEERWMNTSSNQDRGETERNNDSASTATNHLYLKEDLRVFALNVQRIGEDNGGRTHRKTRVENRAGDTKILPEMRQKVHR